MRKDEVITGIIMMVLGFGIAVLLLQTISDYESTSGELERAISEDAQEDYEETVMIFNASACCGGIGVLVLIVGLAREEKEKKQQQIVVPPPQIIYQQAQNPPQYHTHYQPPQQHQSLCPNCGTQIQPQWNLCPNCGFKI